MSAESKDLKTVKDEVLESIGNKLPEKVEIVLKQNQADIIHEETPVTFSGVIDSPLKWLQKRIDLIDQKKCHIIVSVEDQSITLITEERDHFKNRIIGILEDDETFRAFAINTEQEALPHQWAALFKKHKYAFDSLQTVNDIIVSLLNFTVKVDEGLVKGKDNRGSEKISYEREVKENNLPGKFRIKLPIFKGYKPEVFDVEFDVSSSHGYPLSLWSDYVQVKQKEVRDEALEKVIEGISKVAPDIVVFYR